MVSIIIMIKKIKIKKFTYSHFAGFLVIFMNKMRHAMRLIIHIDTWWVRIQTNGMELIALFYGNFSKCGEVFVQNGFRYLFHVFWHTVVCSVLQQFGCFYWISHTNGWADFLSFIADHQNEHVHFWPVTSWCDLNSKRITSIGQFTSLPLHEPAVNTATCWTRAQPSDSG